MHTLKWGRRLKLLCGKLNLYLFKKKKKTCSALLLAGVKMVVVIKLFFKTPLSKRDWVAIHRALVWICLPKCKGERGQRRGLPESQSSGLGVYDDELQPCSLGRAWAWRLFGSMQSEIKRVTLHVLMSHLYTVNVLWESGGLFAVNKCFWIEGRGC